MDKCVARAAAEMLNGQLIGGKKGTRFRDDVWSIKYLPRFKWNMLTEQIGTPLPHNQALTILSLAHRSAAHESATRTARLRVELSQSRSEQKEYLRNVELARVLAKREEKKAREDLGTSFGASKIGMVQKTERIVATVKSENQEKKRRKRERGADAKDGGVIDDVLLDVF